MLRETQARRLPPQANPSWSRRRARRPTPNFGERLLFLPAKRARGAQQCAAQKQDRHGGRFGNGAELKSIDGRCLRAVGAVECDQLIGRSGGESADDKLADATNRVRGVVIEANGITGGRDGAEIIGAGGVRAVEKKFEFVLLADR